MKKAILYVHGKGGTPEEAGLYEKNCPGYAIIGADYTDFLPWIAAKQIRETYETLRKQYDEISLLTNSVGTYFAMLGLWDCPLRHAYCISPILNMERLITDMMTWAGVGEEKLREKQEIPTEFGETLSWDYLCYVRDHPIRWAVPTSILYAGGDELTARYTVDDFVRTHPATLTVLEEGEHWFHTPRQMAFLDAWMQREVRLAEQ